MKFFTIIYAVGLAITQLAAVWQLERRFDVDQVVTYTTQFSLSNVLSVVVTLQVASGYARFYWDTQKRVSSRQCIGLIWRNLTWTLPLTVVLISLVIINGVNHASLWLWVIVSAVHVLSISFVAPLLVKARFSGSLPMYSLAYSVTAFAPWVMPFILPERWPLTSYALATALYCAVSAVFLLLYYTNEVTPLNEKKSPRGEEPCQSTKGLLAYSVPLVANVFFTTLLRFLPLGALAIIELPSSKLDLVYSYRVGQGFNVLTQAFKLWYEPAQMRSLVLGRSKGLYRRIGFIFTLAMIILLVGVSVAVLGVKSPPFDRLSLLAVVSVSLAFGVDFLAGLAMRRALLESRTRLVVFTSVIALVVFVPSAYYVVRVAGGVGLFISLLLAMLVKFAASVFVIRLFTREPVTK